MADFNPSHDHFEHWVYTMIGEDMNIQIEQIKVITRFTFLVVISNWVDQKVMATHGTPPKDGEQNFLAMGS